MAEDMADDVTAVIVGADRRETLVAAVESVLRQTVRPAKIIVVGDEPYDGEAHESESYDAESLPRPEINVIKRDRAGISAARNKAIASADTPYVLMLDDADRLLPDFLAETLPLLRSDGTVIAVSGWLKCFGVLDCVVRPTGGTLPDFLPRNCCPATCLFRRESWRGCGGYDETLTAETLTGEAADWDFFLRLLENGQLKNDPLEDCECDPRIVVVSKPLVNHFTTSSDSGVVALKKRSHMLGQILERHRTAYVENMEHAVLALDSLAGERLRLWENAVQTHPELRQHSIPTREFLEHPTYGDGGMEAAGRINRARCSAPFYEAERTSAVPEFTKWPTS
ncbi:glycosyl transferase family A [Bifidobacterium margollesii]|uniref:Glycosyl transferase family A n=1 Tax=Bifidobacterium margollesii TaxID=2020964 RepID=A0A2N5J9D4_9BIFI|nr:glycosyltransferase family A protein [Bifidobacterium margollesii]PLS30819.1 glycosyl transferase family A [Bifidobacterium margollesii]